MYLNKIYIVSQNKRKKKKKKQFRLLYNHIHKLNRKFVCIYKSKPNHQVFHIVLVIVFNLLIFFKLILSLFVILLLYKY